MITLDTLRAAALSDHPWVELDKLVRTELAAGRLTRAIYDEIMSLQEAVSDTPGYTDDSHDAIGDTLDALVGFCPADREYKNPPILPTEDEIAKLPRWARVAFAARCARRVLPVLKETWDSAQPQPENHVGWAIDVAELAAATATALPRATVEEADKGLAKCRAAKEPYASNVALSASHAIEAAANPDAVHTRFGAISGAVLAADDVDVWPHIRRDFDHLVRLAQWQKWIDETPVPPEVFGPLWPEGPPKGWPPITDVPPRGDLALTLFARARATEQMVEDDVVNLFNALNSYHITRSGIRLTLEQFRSLIPAFVPAEV